MTAVTSSDRRRCRRWAVMLLGCLAVSVDPAAAQERLLCTVDVPVAVRPKGPAQSTGALCNALSACWHAPDDVADRDGGEITVQLILNDAGLIGGIPRHTFAAGVPTPAARASLVAATMASIRACTPVRMSPAVAGKLAGHMILLHLTYRRPKP